MMSSKIRPENSITTIQSIPQDILLLIFQSLDLAGCLTARRVCQLWAKLGKHPTTLFGRYFEEKAQIEKLVALAPWFSAWQQMPRHWGLHNDIKMLKFSSVCSDIISFFPPFCTQSSKFFSFTRALSFSDRHIFLAHCGNTYFLTPQGQTQLQLDLQTDLEPLVRHTLIVKNVKDSNWDREFSLLGNLPKTEENLSAYQIEHCFPISEDKVAIITADETISLWDLEPLKPVCYKRLKSVSGSTSSQVYKVGDHLLVRDNFIDLKDLSMVKFNSEKYTSVKVFGSFVCGIRDRKKVRLFVLNECGLLERKWNSTVPGFNNLCLENMGEKFIILNSWHENVMSLLILNMDGKVVHSINENITSDEIVKDYEVWAYPTFTQISGNILIFKHPQEHTLYFWHIPTKKCLQKFEWTRAVYDFALYFDNARVQDIRFADGKLTILISAGHVPSSNRPAQFRLFQFDPLNTVPSGRVWGLMHRVFTAAKGLYYAVPGKNPT
jgi:hypothetical protein